MIFVGKTVGSIRLEELLGRGGMGEVYRGFDLKLERVVAVKTIRAENRLSGLARSRFLREARILSKLAHPGICQVYDLIEAEEADFLVLEFVEGETLELLRRRQGLSEREILEIGVRIVEALAVAHREHIIHRDLKPANIMIRPNGAVMILDFGIARSTLDELAPPDPADEKIATLELPPDPESTHHLAGSLPSSEFSGLALTQLGSIVGTAHYMSPEQAQGLELTEASDLFSFGILLQELLTNRPVYPDEALLFLIQRVADNESYPITGVDPEIARLVEDLKHPTPSRRPNAEETRDRLRHLIEKPARQRRRKLRMYALAGAFALLSIVLAVVTFLAVREKRARNRAETLAVERDREAQRANREARTANRVVEFLVGLFEEADPEAARGRDVTVQEIVEAGGRRIGERLTEEPLVQARLQETLGGISWRLGDLAAAAKLLETARTTIERESSSDNTDLAAVLSILGAVYLDLGRFPDSAAALERAEGIYARLPEAPPEDRARLSNNLGALADAQGVLDRAEAHYRRALDLLRTAPEAPPRDIALTLNNLAVLAWRRADYRAASDFFRESLALYEGLLGSDHPHLSAQLNNMGILARDLGDFAESERLHLRALAIAEKALGAAHPDVASILSSLARLYVRQERLVEAEVHLRRALAIGLEAYGAEHAESATTRLRLGDVARRRGDARAAERQIVEALDTLRRTLGDEHPRLVEAWTALARLRLAQGRTADATAALDAAIRIGSASLGAEHPEIVALRKEVAALHSLDKTAGPGGPA